MRVCICLHSVVSTCIAITLPTTVRAVERATPPPELDTAEASPSKATSTLHVAWNPLQVHHSCADGRCPHNTCLLLVHVQYTYLVPQGRWIVVWTRLTKSITTQLTT